MISVLVLTKNEEQNLPGCLASLTWCDDLHVFDSYSTDRTVDIAANAGARITQRHFDDWSSHQNYGLQNIPFKYPWVFYIDADERMTPRLVESARLAVAQSGPYVAFQTQRRDFFMGAWLRHAQATPFYIRLFRPEKLRYERLVNPVSIADGPIGLLSGYLDHYPFSKGLEHWLERHNAYSTLEARQIRINRIGGKSYSLAKAVFGKDYAERRAHQKEAFYRMPARPLLKFLILYIAKGGYLDGYAGLTYAALQSFYEYMIVLKTKETARREWIAMHGGSDIETEGTDVFYQ
jgi:glycosyltransferase involved in cell wall biosynthesis